MVRRSALLLIGLFAALPAHAERRPNLVPEGWTQVMADPETRTRRFEPSDGRASLVTRETTANRTALSKEMDDIAYRPGEKITYQRRGSGWIAVSGYRDDQIFYRKSNLACGGSRWHHIELQYPTDMKKRMDATVTAIARNMAAYGDACGQAQRDGR